MKKIYSSCLIFLLVYGVCVADGAKNPQEDRSYFVRSMLKIATPVLSALSENKLKEKMSVETAEVEWGNHSDYAYLEAFGRLLAGMAPGLELGPDNSDEGKLRQKYIELTRKCIHNATNPGYTVQVRSALYTVIKNQIEAPGTFDENGWLTIGFYGHQRGIAEGYICTGSLYLCSEVFLVLGLRNDDPFWSGPGEEWTQKRFGEENQCILIMLLKINSI